MAGVLDNIFIDIRLSYIWVHFVRSFVLASGHGRQEDKARAPVPSGVGREFKAARFGLVPFREVAGGWILLRQPQQQVLASHGGHLRREAMHKG